jgi:uncharacterized membrane protein
MRVVDVPVSASLGWIREAFSIYRAQPLAWTSLAAGWLLITLALMMVPIIGLPLAQISQPAFFAGMVIACRDQEMGKPVVFAHLVAGFQAAGRPLVQVGSIVLLADILINLAFAASGVLGSFADAQADAKSVEEIMGAARKSFSESMWGWLALALSTALVHGMTWFTAALLAHRAMPASHAIRWSFYALIGNFIPLAFFGVVMMVLFVLGALPLWLGLLVFFPLYIITHYTSFKSIFRADADVA